MTRTRHLIVTAIICVLALSGIAAGWFKPLDAALRDLRFALTERPASGEIVFVEIDTQIMANAGTASRARTIYAQAIDILMEQRARTVVLDVPLQAAMGSLDDGALRDALARAAGLVRTVATRSRDADGSIVLTAPNHTFAALAPPVFVDAVPAEGQGADVYRTRLIEDGWVVESMATALRPQTRIAAPQFRIDFAINLDDVPKTTLTALLTGAYPQDFFEDKQVLIGHASYSQLRSHAVPRYGLVSTPSLQLLAAETVRQERMLTSLGSLPGAIIIFSGALLFALLRPRMAIGSAIVGSLAYAGVLEFTALALQVHSATILDTAGIHVAQIGYLAAAFWHELEHRGHSLSSAARERDSMRGILERVVADNFDGVVVVDHTKTIRAASRLAEDLIAPGLVGRRIEDMLPSTFRKAVEQALERGEVMDAVGEIVISAAGEDRIVEYVVTLSVVDEIDVSAGSAGRVACLTFRDVSERRQVEQRLTYLAQHDPLTGAASRVKFTDEIAALLDTPKRRLQGASVFLVGLSRLKTVNDTLGHAYGDALLKQVVARLDLLGPISVARLEGNAFAVLCAGLLGEDQGQSFADRLIGEVSRPYQLNGHHAIVGARVGMTDSDLSGSAPDALVAHAGLALSIASDQPGNCAVVFSKDMDTRIKSKQDMEVALRAALDNGEFSVHYQPQVDLESGEILGVEALARWTHPELGNVSPAEFIPAAEETGLIIELGRFVLQTACCEVASWPKPLALSVNVSPLQFEYGDVVGDVRAALSHSGMAPERLAVEITESLLVAETSLVTQKLATLRAEGVRVALDDFGTGYSSLSYLGRLPVDTIKIDQSFVRGLPEDLESSAIVRAVLMLSESLGKAVIAEGIESQDQAWLLRLAGCRTGQGFFFARPGPAEKILAQLLESESDKMPVIRTG